MIRVFGLFAASFLVLLAGCNGEKPSASSSSSDGGSSQGNRSAQVAESNQPVIGSSESKADESESAGAEAEHRRIYGTWDAESVDVSQPGDARIRVVFKREGPVHVMAWSDIPFVGQVRDKTAPYTIKDGKISSEALRGGTTVSYHFSGEDRLVIEYKDGKSITFKRLK